MEKEAVRVIVIHEGKLLLVRRNKFGTKYYTLVGGHIEPGETPLAAMLREVDEETSLKLAEPKLVYYQGPYKQYNVQHIFHATYVSGDISMRSDSDEAKANAAGNNTYEPMWVPLDAVGELPFMPPKLAAYILRDAAEGFREEVTEITV